MAEITTDGTNPHQGPGYHRVLSNSAVRCSAARSVWTRMWWRWWPARSPEVVRDGVQVAVVIGGGSFFHAARSCSSGYGTHPQRLHGHARHRRGTALRCKTSWRRHPDPGPDGHRHGAGGQTPIPLRARRHLEKAAW